MLAKKNLQYITVDCRQNKMNIDIKVWNCVQLKLPFFFKYMFYVNYHEIILFLYGEFDKFNITYIFSSFFLYDYVC